MLCERCKKKKAVMFYNENINGRLRSFNLCADCASAMQQSGELEDMSSPCSSFSSPFVQSCAESATCHDLFALPLPDVHTVGSASASPCPLCSATWADIVKRKRVGCPTCYQAFSAEFSALLAPLRADISHNGRVPRSYRKKNELVTRIQALKEQLQQAVQAERFEAAAALRDQIRSMEAEL